MKLSIIIPVYNEVSTVREIIEKVRSTCLPIDREIIVVDDFSTDGTRDILAELEVELESESVHFIYHDKNQGKGAGVRSGIEHVAGDIVVIQDADLEYDPEEFTILLKPFLEGKADAVYGSRFRGSGPNRVLFFWHMVGNRLLTFLSNMCTNLNLTDIETGYKMIRTEIIKLINIEQNRFGFEPEITAKLARIKNIRIYEVGISYFGRTV